MLRLLLGRPKIQQMSISTVISRRRFSLTTKRFSQEWQQYGIPGSNLPFDISNKWKFTLTMFIYTATGFWSSFFIARHRLLDIGSVQETIYPQELTTIVCKDEE